MFVYLHPFVCAILYGALYVYVCANPVFFLYYPLVLKLTFPIRLFWNRAQVLSVGPPAASETHPKHPWGSNVGLWGMEPVQEVLDNGMD